MAKQFEEISPKFQEFIANQKVFFVGTAMKEGRVNVSPKGMDTLRVTGPNRVVWMNLTGSGNETAAHLLYSERMTIMFCAFEGKPLILRLYGKAKTFHERDKEYHEYLPLFPEIRGSRQVVELEVDLVQTSCGFAVPLMDFKEDRTQLKTWTDNKNDEELKAYWQKKNTLSLDGHETGIIE